MLRTGDLSAGRGIVIYEDNVCTMLRGSLSRGKTRVAGADY